MMKTVLFALLLSVSLSLSLSAFAGTLKTNEATLIEVQANSTTQLSVTKMFVTSEIDMVFKIQTTEATRWKAGAQLMDVKGLTLAYGAHEGQDAQANVYQVDGNHMGSIQTNLTMNCTSDIEAFRCQAFLSNQNTVLLTIGR
jgi:hypothetical protein